MNPVFIMAWIGIFLGIALIAFTVVSREKLPSWSVLAFSVTGILITLSGILIALGSAFTFTK